MCIRDSAIVFLVSLLPLGRLSGGVLRDFSLIDDILSEQHRAAGIDIIEDEAPVDSALTAMQRELEAEEKAASADAYTLTIRDDEYVDSGFTRRYGLGRSTGKFSRTNCYASAY